MSVEKPRILYVDDSEDELIIFKCMLDEYCDIYLATSAAEGYEIMKQHHIAIAFADQYMPEETGVEFLERLHADFPDTLRIIVTEHRDFETLIASINKSHVYHYLSKPWNKDALRKLIERSCEFLEHRKQKRLSRDQFLRDLLDAAADAMIIVDASHTIRMINGNVPKLFGYSSKELIGYPIEKLIPVCNHVKLRNEYMKSPKARAMGIGMELVGLKKDGMKFPVLVSLTPFKIAGRVWISSMVRDITKEKQAEINLISSEQRLRAICEAFPDLIFVMDEEGKYLEISASKKNLLHREAKELKGNYIENVLPPTQARQFSKIISDTIAEERSQTIEYQLDVIVGRRWFEGITSLMDLKIDDKKAIVFIARDITERKKTIEALHESERRLKEAQAIAHIGYWEMDLRRDKIICSEEVCRIFGLEPQNFTGKVEKFWDRIHPEDRDCVRYAYWQSVRKKIYYDIVNRVVGADGKIRLVRMQCKTHYDECNNAFRSLGTVQDITRQKLDEEELEKYREHLEELVQERTKELENAKKRLEREIIERKQTQDELDRLFNTTAEGLLYIDKDCTICKVNKTFLRQWRYDEHELVGSKCHTSPILFECKPDFCNQGKCPVKRVQSGVFQKDKEITLKLQDDTKKVFIMSIAPQYFTDGSFAGVLMSYRDITERKKNEVQLKKLSQVAERSPVSVVITDKNGSIEYVNEYFCKLTGYTREEVLGQNPKILKAGKLPQSFYRDLWGTILAGKVWQGDFINKTKDGRKYWESASIAPIINDNKEISHFVALKQDITEQKLMEEKLWKAKITADKASLAKSMFLANMSHEIRTPMNAVLGFIKLALEDLGLSGEMKGSLDKAYLAANSLLRVINDILDVSKLESGKLELEKMSFNLPQLLGNTLQMFQPTTREKGLALTLRVAPHISQNVLGDPVRFKQILINLLGNAVKFTEKGSIRMSVDPSTEEHMLHFAVADTGIGIPGSRLNNIFDPFNQVDETTSRRFGGTGLGTTISKQLVELMNGRIWVESKINKGSTFHFTLPLPATDQPPVEPNRFFSDEFPLPYQRSFRVLLAEDIEDNIFLATIRLEQNGHIVTVSRNGVEAIKAFRRGEIDVILMDIHMPVMDGIEATRHIRDLEAGSGEHVPIIAMTASIMKDETKKYLEAGMNDVIGKPIDFDQLFLRLEKLVPKSVGKALTYLPNPEDTDGFEFPSLKGIDVQKGLKIWQNPKTYAEALLNFAKKYGNAPKEISFLIEKDDMKGAHRIAHSLRGLAGNLAIVDVFSLAGEIENAAKAKRGDTVKKMSEPLVVALKTVVRSIGKLEKLQESKKMIPKVSDYAEVSRLLNEMLAAFEKYNPYLIEPFLTKLKECLPHRQIGPIEKHIKGFDFSSAKDKTIKLAKILDINLEKPYARE